MIKSRKKVLSIAVALVSVLAVCFSAGCSQDRSNSNTKTEHEQTLFDDMGGMFIKDSLTEDLSLNTIKLTSNQYETYGVSSMAESAFVLNATILPESSANQGLTWEIAWKKPNEGFASGKSVTDYVSLSANGLSATLECYQPFASEITVTAISQDNPNIKANCSIGYSQKIVSATVKIGDINVVLGGVTEIQYELCPTVTGMGGEITVSLELSDIYTVKEDYEPTIKFVQHSDMDKWIRLKDKYPTYIQLLYRPDVTDWIGQTYYFDYANDISKWFIFQREGDIKFSDMTTLEVIDYFSNITGPTVAELKLSVQGLYNEFTFSSYINCTGYTNSTPVNSLEFDETQHYF